MWSPAFFAVKPELVLKGGSIAAAPMGDPNASIPTPQPIHYRPMFGGIGSAAANFSDLRQRSRVADAQARSARTAVPVGAVKHPRWDRQARTWCSTHATPHIEVNAETYEVRADGAC